MDLKHLTDEVLLLDMKRTVINVKRLTLELLYHLKEVDYRAAYSLLNYPTLFAYCRNELGFSEQESWARIGAMKTLGKVKGIEDKIQKGSLNLTQVGQLGNFLNTAGSEKKEEETQEILKLIEGKSTRETKVILDEKAGKKEPEMVNIRIGRELYQQFQKLKQKLNKMTDEDLLRFLCELPVKKEKIVSLDEEVMVKNPHSRYIPLKLKRKLLQKSDHQCEYISPITKQRCSEKNRLTLHHCFPFAMGGPTSESNVSIRCSAHNFREGVVFYGAHKMNSFKSS